VRHVHTWQPRAITSFALALVLVAIIACGAPAATPTPDPSVGQTPGASPAPTAEATSTLAAPGQVQPAGTLNSGLPELGRYGGHPALSATPALPMNAAAHVGEGLLLLDINKEIQGWLLESWSISEDSTTWTLNLHQGVQFHKGYGEMTSEDVAWSYEQWSRNDRHARVAYFREFWEHPEGYVETPDPYTVEVHTGVPLSPANVKELWMVPSSAPSWIASKNQSDEIGPEAADLDPALTGPWEIVSHRTGEWRLRAVENHWLHTPYFAELVLWEIPEESARLAGFQTGNLDTFVMSFDSIPLVEQVQGSRLMTLPGGPDYSLNFTGNYHVEMLAGEPQPSFKPDMPWISGSAEVDSQEWQQAAMVRRAMSIAIDREAIIDTLLHGYARPGVVLYFSNNEQHLEDRRWEYDPELARTLLAEAGYAGGGFSITLTPAIRAAPAEVELCEAIGTMWNNELGIDVRLQRVPYETLRPQIVARNYEGAFCLAGPQRMIVGALPHLTTMATVSFGATHPYIEERIIEIGTTIDDTERERLEAEWGRFVFDNALTFIGIAVGDSVWPLGPRIEEWTEHVHAQELRFPNGYEYIRHRQ
jgi:ABC-type transport system substrate-binding protein